MPRSFKMLADAHDFEKLISIWIHTEGALGQADITHLAAVINQTGAALDRNRDSIATTLVIVESSQFPDAKQRQQLAFASRRLTRGYVALVNRSMLIRGVVTAIRWLNSRNDYFPRVFATYDEARAWLVERSGHPPAAFDALYSQARSKTRISVTRNAAHP